MKTLALVVAILLAVVALRAWPIPYEHMTVNTVRVWIVNTESKRRVAHGSGVIYNGYIITAGHVTEPVVNNQYYHIEVEYYDGRTVRGKIVDSSVDRSIAQTHLTDLAIIKVPDYTEGVDLNCSIQPVGTRVFVSGHPNNLQWAITSGHVIAVRPRMFYEYGAWLQIDATTWKGNSGGPVFDRWGRLIGIISHGNVAGFGAPTGHNFAQSGEVICNYLDEKGVIEPHELVQIPGPTLA